MLSKCVIHILLVLAPGAFALQQESATPVPGKEAQESLLNQLQELFKGEFSSRNPERRIDFARMLLKDSVETADTNQRFVMLVQARDLAAQGGDVVTSFSAIRLILDAYDVRSAGEEWSSINQKLAALTAAKKAARTPEAAKLIASGYLNAATDGLNSAHYKAAKEAAKLAGSAARMARDATLAAQAKALAKEISVLEKEFKGVESAELKLSVNPDDPDANLAVGRFYCLVRDDWVGGLPCLAKGSDADFKSAAERELANPKDAKEQAAIGEAWLSLSQKERGSIGKTRLQQRASRWFTSALKGADGFLKLKIQKSMAGLPKVTGQISGVIVSYKGPIEIITLKPNIQYLGNRPYSIPAIPSHLEGLQFTRLTGNAGIDITYQVAAGTRVYLLLDPREETAKLQETLPIRGWKQISNLPVTDTMMQHFLVYERVFRYKEELTLAWAGFPGPCVATEHIQIQSR